MYDTNFNRYNNKKPHNNFSIPENQFLVPFLVHNWNEIGQMDYYQNNIITWPFSNGSVLANNTPTSKTNDRKSFKKFEDTFDFLSKIENRNDNYYTDKDTIDKIGQIEAKGEDFSLLTRKIMSFRASNEGGVSVVYKYSDNQGTKYLIHEVTDLNGFILHRDFDTVRIASGQLINKRH